MDFLKNWPTLQELRKGFPETLLDFFRKHNSRSPERIAQRLEEIRKAVQATKDEAVLAAGVTSVANRVRIVASLCEAIDDVDAETKDLMKTHPVAQELKAHSTNGRSIP